MKSYGKGKQKKTCTHNQTQVAKVSSVLNEKRRLGEFSPNNEYRRLEGTMTELRSVGLVKGQKLLWSQGIGYFGDHPDTVNRYVFLHHYYLLDTDVNYSGQLFPRVRVCVVGIIYTRKNSCLA